METAIGLLELKSTPIGIQAADEMLKAANVKLLVASPVCPGKYIIIISGNVGSINSAMKVGKKIGTIFVVSEHIINRVHESLPSAIIGIAEPDHISSLGVIETMSSLASVLAGDIAAKASNVQLIEIRIARGLGGKGFLVFTGEISAVRSAIGACVKDLGESGEITSHVAISALHPDLIRHLTS